MTAEKQFPASRNAQIFAALIITVLCYLYWSFTGTLYNYLDNMTVGMVSAGMFGGLSFCQYIHPLLNLLIYGLSAIMPFADVFATLVHIGLCFSVFMVSLIGIRMVSRNPIRKWDAQNWICFMLLILAVLFYSIGLNLWGVNYTVQTASILFAGLVTLSYAMETGQSRKWIAAGSALIAFGYMLRLEATLLFMPFLALEILTGILISSDKKRSVRKSLETYLPAVIAIAVLLISKGAFNSVEPYASDNQYTKYRTIIEDYQMAPYDAALGEAAGVDVETYQLASRSWVLIDTERLDTQTLKSMAEIGSRNAFQYNMSGLRMALKEMAFKIRTTDVYLMVFVALIIVLTVGNILCAKSWWLKLEALFTFLGGFVILLYFTFRGRALMRVWQTVLLCAAAVLVCNVLHIVREKRQNEKNSGRISGVLYLLLVTIVLYYSAGQMIAHAEFHGFISPIVSRHNVDDSAYEQTWEDDGLYIWSNWYQTVPVYFANQNKLPTQRVIDHNIPVGDWTYGQVYFRKFLEERNASNPAIALIERPHTYLMSGYVRNLMDYMRAFYGEDLELVEVGEINGITAYQMIHGMEEGETNETNP